MTAAARLRAFVLAMGISCVPAAAVPDPRGAAGVIVEPSAASRGEPFDTSDGWTVQITTFAVSATVITGPVDATPGSAVGGEGAAFVWNGGARAELVVPAVRVGARTVTISTQGRREGERRHIEIADVENTYPDPSVAERLLTPVDMSDLRIGPPSFVLAGSAEKAGRTVVFDLTVQGVQSERVSTVDVPADDVVFVRAEIAAEVLFVDLSSGMSTFDDVADADRSGNADGRVTVAELAAVTSDIGNLYERFGARAAGLIRAASAEGRK